MNYFTQSRFSEEESTYPDPSYYDTAQIKPCIEIKPSIY